MELAVLGLGRMGANMARRLLRAGHRVIGYNRTYQVAQQLAQEAGLIPAETIPAAIAALTQTPRVVWIMLPAGETTDQAIRQAADLLAPGDIVVDGGNTYYKDDLRRAAWLKEKGLHYVDVGTSGGIWGLTAGYSLMIGGDPDPVAHLTPLFQALAPAPDRGWGHVGPVGAGHFVKMIHNGIEYGIMQAYAEGFDILRAKQEYHFDLHQIAEIWRYGSVVRSWLLDLTADALREDQTLSEIAGYVEDSGEGRWTVFESIDLDVPAPVITLSLQQRFISRQEESYAAKLLAAMRHKFGGHAVKKASGA